MKLSNVIPVLIGCLALAQVVATSASIAAAESDQPQSVVRSQPFAELLSPDSDTRSDNALRPPVNEREKREDSTPSRLAPQLEAQQINLSTTPSGAERVVVAPPELIAQAMKTPQGNELAGRGMSLVEALSYAGTPQRQLEVTHAYWRLAAAVAEYNLQCRLVRRLDISGVAAGDLPVLQTAQASATAALEDDRSAAIAAQHDLAQAAMLPLGSELPLPLNIPHVGTYHTHFAEIFSRKPAPPALRLIDRVLPIYCKAIDARAIAIAAAERSFDSALQDYRSGQVGIDDIVSRADSLGRQQQAMVDSVCGYNHEIVEYAVASLSQPVSASALVSMLIKTEGTDSNQFDSGGSTSIATRPVQGQPTLAPPRGAVRHMSHDEPIDNSPSPLFLPDEMPSQNPLRGGHENARPSMRNPIRGGSDHLKATPSTDKPLRLLPPEQPARELTPVEPSNSGAASNTSEQIETVDTPRPERPSRPQNAVIRSRPLVPVPARPQTIFPHDRNKRQHQPAVRYVGKPPTGLHGDLDFSISQNQTAVRESHTLESHNTLLADSSTTDLLQRLTDILHDDIESPADTARPIALADYLSLASGVNRQPMIEAFWLSRQRTAEYQALQRQDKTLGEMQARYSQHNQQATATQAATERLTATRAATDAEMIDAHIRLIRVQYELANLAGKALEPTWLTAATTPRWTYYNTTVSPDVAPVLPGQPEFGRTQPGSPTRLVANDSWPLARLRAIIPSMHATLCRRGTALAECDAACERAIKDLYVSFPQTGRQNCSLDRTIDCIIHRTEETMLFLSSLNEYNNAVAGHALATLPTTVSGRQLTETLLN